MASRHESRKQAIQLLYNVEFMNVSLENAKGSLKDVSDDALSFAAHVLNDINNIDQIIEKSLTNYSLTRLNLVDKAIIRLATYELIAKTPKNVVINEALELTKEFSDLGDQKAVKFNNKLLDNISKNIN